MARIRHGAPCQHRSAGWLDRVTTDGGIMCLEGRRTAGQRSPRSDEVAERIDVSRLLQDLLRGAVPVSVPVAIAMKLIGPERDALDHELLGTSFDPRKIRPGDLPWNAVFGLIDEHDLGAERAHHRRAFGAVPARHHRHERVALDAAHDGESRAHVAARELDDRLPRHEKPHLLGFFDDAQGRAVFLGKARIQIVELREDPPLEAASQPRERDEGSLPDGFEQ